MLGWQKPYCRAAAATAQARACTGHLRRENQAGQRRHLRCASPRPAAQAPRACPAGRPRPIGGGGPSAQPWAGQHNAASPPKGGDQGGVPAGPGPPRVPPTGRCSGAGAAPAQAAARRRSSAPSARVTLLRCLGAHSRPAQGGCALCRALWPRSGLAGEWSGAGPGLQLHKTGHARCAALQGAGQWPSGAMRPMEGALQKPCIDLALGGSPFSQQAPGNPSAPPTTLPLQLGRAGPPTSHAGRLQPSRASRQRLLRLGSRPGTSF